MRRLRGLGQDAVGDSGRRLRRHDLVRAGDEARTQVADTPLLPPGLQDDVRFRDRGKLVVHLIAAVPDGKLPPWVDDGSSNLELDTAFDFFER